MAKEMSRPKLPEPVRQKLIEIKEERDFASGGEAIRAVMMEAGYDV